MFRKRFGAIGAVAASTLLAGSIAIIAAPAAQATGIEYGSISVSPTGPYTSGQVITINYTNIDAALGGASSGGGYFIGYCVGDGIAQLGVASCGPTTQYFFQATPLGTGSTSFTVPDKYSDAGFGDYPGYVCDNTTHCNIAVGDFSGNGPAQIQIDYVAVATTTTLADDQGGSAEAGTTVTLTASVSSGAGEVQFRNGATNLGSPVAVSGGQAQWSGTLPVGNLSLAADYLPAVGSDEEPSTGTLSFNSTQPPAAATSTALSVNPATAEALSAVTLTGTVTPSSAVGSCEFVDNGSTTLGSAPVSAGTCELVYSSFTEGTHDVVANFVPTNPVDFQASSSAVVTHTATAVAAAPAVGDLEVTVPAGTLTITTPYGVGNPYTILPPVMSADGTSLNNFPNNGTPPGFEDLLFPAVADDPIRITDLRSGDLGWTAYARVAGDFDGPGGATIAASGLSLAFDGIPNGGVSHPAGNNLVNGDVTSSSIYAFSTAPQPFASAASGKSVGTAEIRGYMGITMPTSTPAGTYTNVLTLTVS